MKVDRDIVSLLERATCDGRKLFLPGQIDRSTYAKVNKALEAAGGKWNRSAGAHVFDADAEDAIDPILLTGSIQRDQDFGFFETPASVVDRLIEKADLAAGMTALEPSAGKGAIARKLRAAGLTVLCVELLEKNTRFLWEAQFPSIIGADFLLLTRLGPFDRVVMNPPFAKQADIVHVRHALSFLKPDGLLVSVMSAGVLFRDNKPTVAFRELVAQRGGSIEPLPDGSFLTSGTSVRTCIATIPGPDWKTA